MALPAAFSRRMLFAQQTLFHIERLYPRLPLSFPSYQPIRLATAALPALGTTFSDVGSWISGLWDSVLKAVPKKKQSYSRKRKRQLTGKALQDIERFVPCPSCGRPKKPHILCLNCVALVKQMWIGKYDEYKPLKEPTQDPVDSPKLEAPKSKPKPKGPR